MAEIFFDLNRSQVEQIFEKKWILFLAAAVICFRQFSSILLTICWQMQIAVS